jgi:hypothetical protein
MDPNKNCVFFAGGKKFNADPDDNKSFATLRKTADGFTIKMELSINKEEAKNSIYNFSDLNVPEEKIPDLSNLVFLEAYSDETGTQKEIEIKIANFIIAFDKGDNSELILKASVANSGKTDHSKTDHSTTGEGNN